MLRLSFWPNFYHQLFFNSAQYHTVSSPVPTRDSFKITEKDIGSKIHQHGRASIRKNYKYTDEAHNEAEYSSVTSDQYHCLATRLCFDDISLVLSQP